MTFDNLAVILRCNIFSRIANACKKNDAFKFSHDEANPKFSNLTFNFRSTT